MINVLHRKDILIYTAIDVINESGIQSFSTKEVANRAGVSEATIFKHFNKKQDLILAVLDHFCQYDSDIFKSTNNKKLNFSEKILFFFKSFVSYYENYPEITAILFSYDALSTDPAFRDKVYEIFQGRYNFVKQLIIEAQENGDIDKNIDPLKLSLIFVGNIRAICLKWRQDGFNFSLTENTKESLLVLLNAFLKES